MLQTRSQDPRGHGLSHQGHSSISMSVMAPPRHPHHLCKRPIPFQIPPGPWAALPGLRPPEERRFEGDAPRSRALGCFLLLHVRDRGQRPPGQGGTRREGPKRSRWPWSGPQLGLAIRPWDVSPRSPCPTRLAANCNTEAGAPAGPPRFGGEDHLRPKIGLGRAKVTCLRMFPFPGAKGSFCTAATCLRKGPASWGRPRPEPARGPPKPHRRAPLIARDKRIRGAAPAPSAGTLNA